MGEHDLRCGIKIPEGTVHRASTAAMQQFSGMPTIPRGPVCVALSGHFPLYSSLQTNP